MLQRTSMFTMMLKLPAKLQKSDKKFFCRSFVVVDTNKNKILTLEHNCKMLTNGYITLFVGVFMLRFCPESQRWVLELKSNSAYTTKLFTIATKRRIIANFGDYKSTEINSFT